MAQDQNDFTRSWLAVTPPTHPKMREGRPSTLIVERPTREELTVST